LLVAALALAAHAPLLWQLPQAWRGSDSARDVALLALALHLGLAATLAAVFGRMRWWLPLLGLAALLGPAEAFYLSRFGIPSGPHLYGVIAETDWNEASALLGGWLMALVIVVPLAMMLVALAVWHVWKADPRWSHRSRSWVILAALVFATSIGWGEHLVASTESTGIAASASQTLYLEHPITERHAGLLADLEATFPWGLPIRLQRYVEHKQALAEHMSRRMNFRFDPQWAQPLPIGLQIHVFVIGESARADHWSLFGYARDTTPEMLKRERAGELAVFDDAVSAASATRESVPLMLTRRPVAAPLLPTGEPSVLTAFSHAGFRTYWLSAQGTAGTHETPVSVLAAEADQRKFINHADYSGLGAQDGALLPLLAEALKDPNPRKFIVLHTLGSHLNYAHRYPATFDKFTPSLKASERPDVWRANRSDALINAYDNSVLYTDHVLNQVVRLVAQTGASATVTYAADHGETFADGNCKQGGHGFAAKGNYHIPMFIWASPSWRASRADTWTQLGARRNAPVTTLSLFSTLTDLAGFDANLGVGPGALGDPAWKAFPRPVTHFGDFDQHIRRSSCDATPEDRARPS
jgi:glucan phosphoethanolaminetransferase (alkaline phosphatase superfamily)